MKVHKRLASFFFRKAIDDMFFCSALQAVVVAAAVRCASFVIWPFLAATRYCCRCSCARNCVLRR